MVTNKGASANLEGKSTDVKPTTGVDVNTKFHELDTDKWYYFTGETWAEIPSSGGGFTPTEQQLTAMNSGITSADVEQINTNKTNISSEQAKTSSMGTAGTDYIVVNGTRIYVSSTQPTGTIPEGSLWFDTAVNSI